MLRFGNHGIYMHGSTWFVNTGTYIFRYGTIRLQTFFVLITLFNSLRVSNKTPAEQRDIFRPELFYNYISLRLKNKPMHNKNANKFERKENFDSSYPILKETPNLSFQRAGHFSFFRHYATYREKKFSINFLKINFLKQFSKFFRFSSFSVKETSFPSLEGDLFVTFDHVELMSFLLDCGKYLIYVFFDYVPLSETFIWSKCTPCFHSTFRLEKSSFAS